MRFPISYARSRTFSPATLPASVQSFYAVSMSYANTLLATHFPSTGPGSNFAIIAFDVEYKGRKHSDSEMRLLPVPLPLSHRRSHFLRLLTIARDGVVIAFDLVALGAIPGRLIEIFADPTIIKVGIELKSDCILILRHFAVAVYNGWELSQLWKSMHPSIEAGPLTSHISLDDMARITVGVRVMKEMQRSDWGTSILTEEQIDYALMDAYMLIPMIHVVLHEYAVGVWPDFDASAFSFNADLVSNGAVTFAGPQTLGSHIRVWGVGHPVPSASTDDWTPRHPVLDAYRAAIYNDCRSMAARRFYAKEGKILLESSWKMVIFTAYRVSRWIYMHAHASPLALSYLLLPLLALVVYTYA